MAVNVIPAKNTPPTHQAMRHIGWFWGAFILGIGIFLLLPTHYVVHTQAIAIPAEEATLSAEAYGTIEDIYVATGDWVAAGTPLLRINSPTTEAALAMAEADISLSRLRAAYFAESSKPGEEAQTPLANLELKSAWANLQSARLKHNQLTLKAPITGKILPITSNQGLPPRLSGLKGLFVGEGTPLLRVANTHNLKLLIALPEDDAPLLEIGALVKAKWVATGESFETHLTELPQRKTPPAEYVLAFYTTFGGPAPQQDLQAIDPENQADHLYPIFIAQASVPSINDHILDQMRAIVTIEGRRTLTACRLWRFLRILL